MIPCSGFDRMQSYLWYGVRVCLHRGALSVCDMDCSPPPKATPGDVHANGERDVLRAGVGRPGRGRELHAERDRRDASSNGGHHTPNHSGLALEVGVSRPKTTEMDKKHGSRQESHLLVDRTAIDWPCRT